MSILLSYRCRMARAKVRAACGYCPTCKQTKRGSQVRLARLIGVDPPELSRFIGGRDIGGGFLLAVEAWAAEQPREGEG